MCQFKYDLSLMGDLDGPSVPGSWAVLREARKSVVCSPVEKWRAAAGDVSLYKNTM